MSASVTMKELVENCQAHLPDVSKVDLENMLVGTFNIISDALINKEEVVIRDFGRFFTKTKPAHAARNPKTGEAVQVEERTSIKFAPRGSFKDSLG